ncbi:MAG: DUF4325 domain-containing protein [Patescibacteria group bacterium]
MIINLNKFGSTLVSRPSGKEASLAFNPTLREVKPDEKIEIDFTGVEVLTPSWADEFLTPIFNSFKDRVDLINTQNSSVIESLKILNLI